MENSLVMQAAREQLLMHLQAKIQTYRLILDSQDADNFKAVETFRQAARSKLREMLLHTFYIGEKIAQGVRQDLGVVISLKKLIKGKEERKQGKELILASKSLLGVQMVGDGEQVVDVEEGYRRYLTREQEEGQAQEMLPDEEFEGCRVYYAFLHFEQSKLMYCSPDGEVRTKKPVVFLPGMHFCKVCYTPDEQVYILGGAKDELIAEVSDRVFKYTTNQTGIARMSNMNYPRANFGCILHIKSGTIFVVGGDTVNYIYFYKRVS